MAINNAGRHGLKLNHVPTYISWVGLVGLKSFIDCNLATLQLTD
jgi:hypothetical protein